MKRLLAALAMIGLAAMATPAVTRLAAQTAATAVVGSWQGALPAGAMNLRVAFKIAQGANGTLTATMDSLDQGVTGIPMQASVTDDGLRLALPGNAGAFTGKLSADGSQLSGTWTQNGASIPLTLKRGDAQVLKRPQVPVKPYPYIEEEVRYQNRSAGNTLAGTLTLPSATGRYPAVILISGSGAEDRDETLFGHKPFLVLADHLSRNGVAVLRVDDRGVGGSSGRTDTATSEDFAGDVVAGLEYLKSRREIDTAHIGLIGHSEGGLIAPMVAIRSRDVAFIVMLAGPGLPGEDILYQQIAALNKSAGATDDQTAAALEQEKRIISIIKGETDPAALDAKFTTLIDELTATAPPAQKQAAAGQLRAQLRTMATPWYRYFISFDPRPTLLKVACPVLALNGERDVQVPWAENLPAIEAALKAGGNKDVTTVHFPQLNHLFQTAVTGSPNEYPQIEETMAPVVLKTVSDWIARHTR